MQRELQWFKEVEKFVEPSYKEALNNEKKTPRMVFTSEHKEILKEAQLWMKDTSSSATVVVALLVTMAFAAIFTAPGGNNDDGKPLFLNESVFMLFAISDAITLFSSSTSVLVFLSVLNSRFAEEDFLYALPKRLTIGLIALFISRASTMVTFSATLALVLRDKIKRIAVPVTLLAGAPVTLFLLLQYPLLVELVRSTYGRGIFFKQSNLLLH
ncbi:ankyrin repeat-containing protein ITN1-like [Heracleum sosnowskyi]|uniref:Ankyrin repeat-containing protein ITN1-like n=1 Tax=Heracleum sosnowskyi TaxID=360622 RepID=A0AAD8H6D5_9APIA|nr:ankyrin repeat-containing protein ITN1-like [Heracleum sosnowskyi]